MRIGSVPKPRLLYCMKLCTWALAKVAEHPLHCLNALHASNAITTSFIKAIKIVHIGKTPQKHTQHFSSIYNQKQHDS